MRNKYTKEEWKQIIPDQDKLLKAIKKNDRLGSR